MDVQTETTYFVRMTRLEAARTLVDPKELQTLLRARLTESTEQKIVEGSVVTPALTAGDHREESRKRELPSPYVRKAMRRLHKKVKPTYKCPHGCPGDFKNLKQHLTLRHGSKLSQVVDESNGDDHNGGPETE